MGDYMIPCGATLTLFSCLLNGSDLELALLQFLCLGGLILEPCSLWGQTLAAWLA